MEGEPEIKVFLQCSVPRANYHRALSCPSPPLPAICARPEGEDCCSRVPAPQNMDWLYVVCPVLFDSVIVIVCAVRLVQKSCPPGSFGSQRHSAVCRQCLCVSVLTADAHDAVLQVLINNLSPDRSYPQFW